MFGDYEIFHSLLVHERRQKFGVDYPYFGVQSHVAPSVIFEKKITAEEDGEVTFYVKGKAYVVFDGVFYATGKPIRFSAGKHDIFIRVTNPHGLPAVFAEGDIATDESWSCGVNGYTMTPVGAAPAYWTKDDDVEVFPFAYERKSFVACEKSDEGWLYDFGAETFAKLYVETTENGVGIYYGESREEALAVSDPNPAKNAVLFEKTDIKGRTCFPTRAFRYVHIVAKKEPESVYAEHEFLPQQSVSTFSCENALAEQIFRVATDTFLLNSREFYLDGIKRDRWVWAGDAYQSFMINRYATNDAEIMKRTILALLGKPPYIEHVNTINDYTLYLLFPCMIIGTLPVIRILFREFFLAFPLYMLLCIRAWTKTVLCVNATEIGCFWIGRIRWIKKGRFAQSRFCFGKPQNVWNSFPLRLGKVSPFAMRPLYGKGFIGFITSRSLAVLSTDLYREGTLSTVSKMYLRCYTGLSPRRKAH